MRVETSLPPLSRGLWLVKWILVFPDYLVLGVTLGGLRVLSAVAMVAIVSLARCPAADLPVQRGRTAAGNGGCRLRDRRVRSDRYPPFTLADDPAYPAHLEVEYPQRLSRRAGAG